MTPGTTEVRAKWRPSLALVIGLVCAVLVSVPVLAFLAMRLSSNQFVRETEQSLIAQAAIHAEIYRTRFAALEGGAIGPELPPAARRHWAADWHPWAPTLNLRRSEILPPLPDPGGGAAPADARHRALAPDLLALARGARRTTLAGAFVLDHRGVSLDPEAPQDLSAAPEVRAALAGGVGTALRDRGDSYARHPLTSISRDTWYRVFVAFPVILDERVIGVVYLSRTPSSLAKFALAERGALAAMFGAMLLAAGIVGVLLLRLILGPVRRLSAQGQEIAEGHLPEARPLRRYGVRELADLGGSVIRMAKTLTDRSRQVAAYTDHVTHELKSPVTAILGAAELLGEDGLAPEARARLRRTIEGQARRMNALLEGLRDLARLRHAPTTGTGALAEMLPEVPGLAVEVEPGSAARVPLLPEHGRIVLHQLARNAREAGARTLGVAYRDGALTLRDDGAGIDPRDAERALDPFFTTRREAGGTGLGLAIVGAVLQNYGATLRFEPAETGAAIRIVLPQGEAR